VLTLSVLADVGLDTIAADSWICVYNHMRRSWQRVKPNHVLPVDEHADVYVKAVSVKRCPQLEDYLALTSQSRNPHFYNLRSERASVVAKAKQYPLRGLLLSHSSEESTPNARARKRPRFTDSPLLLPSLESPAESSDDGSYLDTPTPRRRTVSPDDSFVTSIRVPLPQQEAILAPVEVKPWPSRFRISDVVNVFEECEALPVGKTVKQVFESLVGIPFKSSTFYDAKSRWKNATQEQRDMAEDCGTDKYWEFFTTMVCDKDARAGPRQ